MPEQLTPPDVARAAGTPKPADNDPDRSAEEITKKKAAERMAKKQLANDAIDVVVELYKDSDVGDAVREAGGEWRLNLRDALVDKPGSVKNEHPEVAEPLALLAERAFRSFGPRSFEGSPKTDELEARRQRDAAARTVDILLDRYPNTLPPRDMQQKNFGQVMEKLGQRMSDAGINGGGSLQSLSREKGLPPEIQIMDMDRLLANMAEQLASHVHANLEDGADAESRRLNAEGIALVLPQMKALRDLRRAVSREAFHGDKTADEILAIVETKRKLNEPGVAQTGVLNEAELSAARARMAQFDAADRAKDAAAAEKKGKAPELSPEQAGIKELFANLSRRELSLWSGGPTSEKTKWAGFDTAGTFLEAAKLTSPDAKNAEQEALAYVEGLTKDVEDTMRKLLDGSIKIDSGFNAALAKQILKVKAEGQNEHAEVLAQELASYLVYGQKVEGRMGRQWDGIRNDERERLKPIAVAKSKALMIPSAGAGFHNLIAELRRAKKQSK